MNELHARVDVQLATQSDFIPDNSQINQWVNTTLACAELPQTDDYELSIRIVSEKEITELNKQYRHKDNPTNVLSFPYESMPGIDIPLLGDIVICADVVNREAKQQEKAPIDHWAHMLVHGVLHLLGYDHIEDKDAEQMEGVEIHILKKMGIDNPYLDKCEQQGG